ncbi:MAG: MFS transporter [Candidatus Heimdallarchaeaceae archaeon]
MNEKAGAKHGQVTTSEPTYADVFKNKDFVKLLSGQFFSNFGDAIYRIAIMYYVYWLSGNDERLMTAVLAAQIVPWIIIGPFAGVLADRISRKYIMVAADLVRGVSILFLPFFNRIYPIVIISFILGIASSSFAAPRSAAIPEMVGMKLYVKAISISQLVFQTLAVLGPLVAAPIYGLLHSHTFWITSVCFFLSSLILSFTAIPDATRGEEEKLTTKIVANDLKEGLSYLFSNSSLRILILLFTFLIIGGNFAGPLLLPWLFKIRYLGNEALRSAAELEYGILGAIIAFGAIVGNLIFGNFEKFIGRSRAIIMGSLATGGYYIIFLFKPFFYLIAIIGFIMGTLNGMLNLSVNAIVAEIVPNSIRGRVYSAINAYLQMFSALCFSLSGVTASLVGIALTMALAGLLILISTVILSFKTNFFQFTNIMTLNTEQSVSTK